MSIVGFGVWVSGLKIKVHGDGARGLGFTVWDLGYRLSVVGFEI